MAKIKLVPHSGINYVRCNLTLNEERCPGFYPIAVTLNELAKLRTGYRLNYQGIKFNRCGHIHDIILEFTSEVD